MKHGLRFYTVGAAGMVVQLAVFTGLTRGLQVGYLAATAIAVELAVLHNFCWHERWTWAERLRVSAAGQAGRLLRFHLSNGIFSILGNLALMALLVGQFHVPPVPANVIAIGVCSLPNFLAADRFVFRAPASPAAEQGK